MLTKWTCKGRLYDKNGPIKIYATNFFEGQQWLNNNYICREKRDTLIYYLLVTI